MIFPSVVHLRERNLERERERGEVRAKRVGKAWTGTERVTRVDRGVR